MDDSVLCLPAQTPLHVAAERAYETRCRYIVALDTAARDTAARDTAARDTAPVLGFTSGMGFAQIVAERGNRPADT
jgi:hypothetical protein